MIPFVGRTFMFCDVCGKRWLSNIPICLECLPKYDVTLEEIVEALGVNADFKRLEKLLDERKKS